MNKAECIERIRQYTDFAALLSLWEELQSRKFTHDWDNGKAFEYLILRAFELEGAEVVWPFEVIHEGSILEQIDGVVYVDNLYCVIEAKDLTEPGRSRANYEPIAKLRAQLQRRPGFVIGIVFSRDGFTRPAKHLTRMSLPHSILLWEGTELSAVLGGRFSGGMRDALRLKLRYIVEQAIPDFYVSPPVSEN